MSVKKISTSDFFVGFFGGSLSELDTRVKVIPVFYGILIKVTIAIITMLITDVTSSLNSMSFIQAVAASEMIALPLIVSFCFSLIDYYVKNSEISVWNSIRAWFRLDILFFVLLSGSLSLFLNNFHIFVREIPFYARGLSLLFSIYFLIGALPLLIAVTLKNDNFTTSLSIYVKGLALNWHRFLYLIILMVLPGMSIFSLFYFTIGIYEIYRKIYEPADAIPEEGKSVPV